TTNGAALADALGDSINNLNIYGNALHVVTASANWSTVQTNLATAIGSDPTASTLVPTLTNLWLDAANDFSIDAPMSYPGGTVMLVGQGGFSQPDFTSLITADKLGVSAVGAVDLEADNAVG